MATDKILVERQTDGERCGRKIGEALGGCSFLLLSDEQLDHDTRSYVTYYYCKAFKEELGKSAYRCPACLSTPSARVLTPEMVQAVKEIVEYRCGYDDAGLEELQDKLRAAFALEVPATEGSWTCGICGARRSGIEPVQDEECGDSCPEHFEEATK